MSYSVYAVEDAQKDMAAIYNYIARVLKEPRIARNQYKRIKEGIRKLKDMPERHELYPDEPWHSEGLRHFFVDNYRVFYWIDEPIKTVVVIRVMYGGRDIAEQLRIEK